MDIGQPTSLGGAAVPGKPEEAGEGAEGGAGSAFYVVVLPDGRVTCEQLQPGQAPSGNARPMELGAALEQIVEAAEGAGGNEEQAAFRAGFDDTRGRTPRDQPPGMRNGGVARAMR